MTISVRALALAIVGALALVAVVVYLAWPGGGHASKSSGGTWYTALATPYPPTTGTRTSACGVKIGPATLGVEHPRLPCGVQIVIEFGGHRVTTRVVDRGAPTPGHDFALTRALARELGLRSTQTIRWRFAQ